MPKVRSAAERAAGKLISAIQHEWTLEAGTAEADSTEAIMHSSHSLHQAVKLRALRELLAGRSVTEYLGQKWVSRHAAVQPTIQKLEAVVTAEAQI
ncbi:MAG: hypothetical protein ACT4NL_13140 [Pseudomarimonas sp.]